MKVVWIVFQLVIGFNLVLPFLLYLFSKITRKRQAIVGLSKQNLDYAVIVTAYQQTELLPSVVDSILKLNYDNYIVYVVADNCDVSNLSFTDPRIVLLRPEQVLAGNVKSHLYAISNFKRQHTVLTIVDSDNLVDPEYINELNVLFSEGFDAVQGLRAAKNLDTVYACLDAARDIYYHFYDGEILFKLGSSATLSGSGMAFKTDLYKSCFDGLNIEGAGFDKVLQAQILKRDIRIAFTKKAIVYDEKTTYSDQLVKQRSRWINTWFKYFGYGFDLIWKGLKRFSFNQFLFGVILLRPPLFMFILLAILCAIIDFFIYPGQTLIWGLAMVTFVFSFIISLKNYPADKRIYRSLINIPRFIFYQLVSLFFVGQANKRSVATKHKVSS